jgi:hypothetical protein
MKLVVDSFRCNFLPQGRRNESEVPTPICEKPFQGLLKIETDLLPRLMITGFTRHRGLSFSEGRLGCTVLGGHG